MLVSTGVKGGVRAGFWWKWAGLDKKWRVRSAWIVKCDGSGSEFIVKVIEQGLSLEANSYPLDYYDRLFFQNFMMSA